MQATKWIWQVAVLMLMVMTALFAGCEEPQATDPTAFCRTIRGPGLPNDRHVNIVFVPSGFNGDWDKFRTQVEKSVAVFEGYTPFERIGADPSIPANVYMVEKEQGAPYCQFNCSGIPRLLCCTNPIAKTLSSECTRGPRQTIVIHNDPAYGGSGSPMEDIGTASTHPAAPHVVVHELGHALFDLGDEYSYGRSTNSYPNCDAAGCSRWNDLITAGFSGVSCGSDSCTNGLYFASDHSVMKDLHRPFLPVNERLTCCTYHRQTGQWPSYCAKFNERGLNLNAFCGVLSAENDTFVANPVWVEMEKDEGGAWKLSRHLRLSPRLFRKDLVRGHAGGDLNVRITANRWAKELAFQSQEPVEVFDADGSISRLHTKASVETLSFVIDLAPENAGGGASVRVNGAAAEFMGR